MNEDCRDIESMLSPYLDGELDPAATQRVEAHIAGCAACRELLEAWSESDAALAASIPVRSDAEWEALAQRVERAVDEEEAREARLVAVAASSAGKIAPAKPRRRLWIWSSGAVAAAVLVLLMRPWIDEPPSPSRVGLESEILGDETMPTSPGPATIEETPEAFRKPTENTRRAGEVDVRKVAKGGPSQSAPSLNMDGAEPRLPQPSTSNEKPAAPEFAAPPEIAAPKIVAPGTLGAEAKDRALAAQQESPQASTPPVQREESSVAGGHADTMTTGSIDSRAKLGVMSSPRIDDSDAVRESAAANENEAAAPEDEASLEKSFAEVELALQKMDREEQDIAQGEHWGTIKSLDKSSMKTDVPLPQDRSALLRQRMHIASRLIAWNRDRWCETARVALREWMAWGLRDETSPADSSAIAADCID